MFKSSLNECSIDVPFINNDEFNSINKQEKVSYIINNRTNLGISDSKYKSIKTYVFFRITTTSPHLRIITVPSDKLLFILLYSTKSL